MDGSFLKTFRPHAVYGGQTTQTYSFSGLGLNLFHGLFSISSRLSAAVGQGRQGRQGGQGRVGQGRAGQRSVPGATSVVRSPGGLGLEFRI